MAPGKPVILATPDGVGLCGNDPVTLDYAMTNYMVVARSPSPHCPLALTPHQRWRVGLCG